MKLTLIEILILLLMALALQARVSAIEIQTHSLLSQKASSTLNFKVALPSGFNNKKAYPVLYTTAGGSRFNSFVHQVNWLSHVTMGPLPQFIIVNVPQVTVESDMHPKYVAASGIANTLQLAVLEHEILPFIEAHFKTEDFRLLEGYSSNGNFVFYTYLTRNTLFDGYFVHSPALELDQSGLITQSNNSHLLTKNAKPMYLSLGPFVNNRALFQTIQANLSKVKSARFEDLSQHNFLSVATVSLNASIEWFFADLSPDLALFTAQGLPSVKAYYQELELKYKKPIDASTSLIDLSFYYAQHGQAQQALDVIDVVIKGQPNSVFYLTRKALILKTLGQIVQSKDAFEQAKIVAFKNQDQDALSFINGELAKL